MFRVGRGTPAEDVRESRAELAEVPAREAGGRMREDVRGAGVVVAPPPHLCDCDSGLGVRMTGEMSEQQVFRVFLLAQLGQLHARNAVGANRFGGKRALDHGEGFFVFAHSVELMGRFAPRACHAEGIVVSVRPQQVERYGEVGGSCEVVEGTDAQLT